MLEDSHPFEVLDLGDAIVLEIEVFEVGANAVDVLDLAEVLLVQSDLLQVVQGTVVVLGAAHQELVRDPVHHPGRVKISEKTNAPKNGLNFS